MEYFTNSPGKHGGFKAKISITNVLKGPHFCSTLFKDRDIYIIYYDFLVSFFLASHPLTDK